MKIFLSLVIHNYFLISLFFNQIKISYESSTINNCIQYESKECIKCKNNYELVNKHCYRKNCEVFGFCKYCDDYDCLKCQKGYKLNYGICDKRETSKKILFLKIIIVIIIIFALLYLYLYKRKKARERIETGQVIKLRHPKSGFYRMNFDKYIPNNTSENIIDFSQSKSLSSNGVDSIDNTPSAEVNLCVACGSKKTYAIADCGCSLCYDDYKIARGDKEKIKCKIHNVFLSSNITFEIYKSNIKGNALDKLGLSKCPVCKINDGTQSFNCGCNMKVCEKCFNDNVYVLKYNQCPGCGMPYVPLKKTKKKKSKEEKKSDKESQ